MVRIKNGSILIFLIIISGYSCNKNITTLIGVYTEKSIGTSHVLSLNMNNKFNYIINEGLLHDTIFGKWKLTKANRLILIPDKILPYHTNIKCNTCKNALCFNVYDLKSSYRLENAHLKIFYKGKIIKKGKIDSLNERNIQNIDSIEVEYIGFEKYVFSPENFENNTVNIYLLDEQTRIIQRDEQLKIRHKKLITPSGMELLKKDNSK